ncbi:hypothetical protein ACFYVL_08800 [Streptomyces sp. NPDC004111]|uniref:hypothetical protein n=1 Tax=Streptomyces sp. NPDC004111 TaxID=3364690 RepID=UPI0036B98D67
MTETLSGGSGWVLGIGIFLLVAMAMLLMHPQSSLTSGDPELPEPDTSADSVQEDLP